MIVLGTIQTFAYRVGESTAHNIIKETYTMLVQVLMQYTWKLLQKMNGNVAKIF